MCKKRLFMVLSFSLKFAGLATYTMERDRHSEEFEQFEMGVRSQYQSVSQQEIDNFYTVAQSFGIPPKKACISAVNDSLALKRFMGTGWREVIRLPDGRFKLESVAALIGGMELNKRTAENITYHEALEWIESIRARKSDSSQPATPAMNKRSKKKVEKAVRKKRSKIADEQAQLPKALPAQEIEFWPEDLLPFTQALEIAIGMDNELLGEDLL